MNLETLKKYWNELEHYKNGGSLLARIWITDDNDGDESYTIWYKVGCECWDINKVYNYTLDYHKVQIIINDEYSIYRKALAEGKTIQIYDVIEQHISDPSLDVYGWPSLDVYGWRDFKSFTSSSLFSKTPNLYRIKSDEPKFKVGDFVRYVHSTPAKVLEINNINGNRYYFTNSEMACLEYELEPWTPVKSEWCWFYDSKSSKSAALAKFNEMWNNKFRSNTDTPWQFCEPFLNSLPSYLKDK